MSLLMGADVADLLDALGHPAEADTVRWGEAREFPPLTAAEIAEIQDQLFMAEGALADLASLLCKACEKKWDKAKA